MLGTRAARASGTKAADGFAAAVDYLVVTDTEAIKGVVRWEMHAPQSHREEKIVYG